MPSAPFTSLGFLLVVVAAVTGCDGGSGDADQVISTFAPVATADALWRTQPGGDTLAGMLNEAGLSEEPRVFTQLVEGVGAPDATLLIATFERPDEVQTQLIDEIQAMEISGLSPFFIGLTGRRDGRIVEVVATTPDGTPGIMFTVLVLNT